jgi:3D (Asp-Asp-Asp) domain-containing protein
MKKTFLLAIGCVVLLANVFIHNEIERSKLQKTLNEVRAAQDEQSRILTAITARVAEMQKIRAMVTAYTLDPKETDSDPSRAADMSRPVPGKTAAVSRDLIHLLGKKIYIPGHGVRVINDLAAKNITGTIDLLVGNKVEACKIGREVREVIVL